MNSSPLINKRWIYAKRSESRVGSAHYQLECNVGGMISDAIVPLINKRARIVICGQMSQYNGQLGQVEMGPRFLHHMLYKRATIQGILARDYGHRMDEMVVQVSPWIKDKSLVFSETSAVGFEHLPDYLESLFERQSVGKLIVKIVN